jgi:peptide/nickel transport system permease protein
VGKYILQRLLLLVPTLVGMSLLIFLMLRLLPGDIVDLLVGPDLQATSQDKENLRRALGLADPLPVQYVKWIGGLLTGDLGVSLRTRLPIGVSLMQSLPITLQLTVMATALAALVAIPLGVVSAVRHNSQTDFWARLAGLIGLSFPSFWLATLFLLFTSLVFQWVPPVIWVSPLEDPLGNLQQMILPALALSVQLMAIIMRMTRTTMLEVLRQDYIRTARAKGLVDRLVIYRHALRNALIPVITIIGIQIGSLMGGSVIIEQIFGLPGVGWWLLQAIYNRDYPVVQVAALLLATVFVLVNLVVDVLYAVIDPRIRPAT